jgi:hypothetical protein
MDVGYTEAIETRLHGLVRRSRHSAPFSSAKKLPAVLPAVGVSFGNFQQLAEPGGTSKLLKILFMLTLKKLRSTTPVHAFMLGEVSS